MRGEEGAPVAVDAEDDEVRAHPRGSGRLMPGMSREPIRQRAGRCAWSSARRSIMPSGPSRSATRPAAARTPTWRMPPPTILRARRARPMKSRSPTTTDPTGQARPFDRQNVAESAPASERRAPASRARRPR